MTLTDSVDIYGSKGAVIGHTKPNIDVHVVTSNENWYCFYFDAEEQGPYQYVLAKVSNVGGEGKVKNTEESYTKEKFFAKVKEVIAKKEEEQKEFDEIYGENPNIDLPAYMLPRKTVEVNSKDGLIKADAAYAPKLYKSMCDGELGNIQNIASIIFSTYEQYYIEVTDETNLHYEYTRTVNNSIWLQT